MTLKAFPAAALLSLGIIAVLLTAVSSGNVGVGYGGIGPYQISQRDQLTKLKSAGAKLLKIYNIDTGFLDNVRAVFGSDVKVTVAIPNSDLGRVASGDQGYLNNVKNQLNQYKDIINLVAVSNEPYLSGPAVFGQVVPAAQRIHQLLSDNGLLSSMKMTVPFSGAILTNTYPVANSIFKPDALGTIQQILSLIRQEGSVFSVNLYAYFAYAGSNDIPLATALGNTSPSLFKNMLDGCKVALNKAGYNGVPVIIGETGWPTAGGRDTNSNNAKIHNENVMRLAGETNGIYLFEAFDEGGKPGDEVERHWGLYSSSGQAQYPFSFGGGGGGGTINWQPGNWAMGCDFPGNDMSNAQIRGEDCSNKCRSTGGCTHYAWTQYNGGTCWMKSGSVSKSDAVVSSEPGAVCGFL